MVEMESVIDTDAPLDYVEFQLFPSRDRYEACACSGNTIETISSGLLGQLALHLPRLKDLFSRKSKATFQIQCPENIDSSQWFTKATVTRFLHVVGSVTILNTTTSIQNEITQLEEAKKFHLSLYAKDESETAPSDASKHELLRAMELRLTTLKTELATALNRAAGSSCTPNTIRNMEKLAQHLGDTNLRNTFRKFLEYNPIDQKVDLPIISNNDKSVKSDEKSQEKKLSGIDTPVKYGASPAKAAQLERESSTESDKSSDSSEDDQPSGERSRSLARVASPRRSASPMRRVQIGRSGSRRAPALTIKSLNIFPGRDKTQSYRDTDTYSSEEEASKNSPKKSDNAVRISVKDAISLFENKQNDNISDGKKSRPTLDAEIVKNKSVLRRWSSGLEERENVSESSSRVNSENVEIEAKTDDIIPVNNNPVEDIKVDENFYSMEERPSKSIDNQPDILVIQHEEDNENLSASSEWNRRKEAELSEMMKKMMRIKPGKSGKTLPSKNGTENISREKKDEKFTRERAEKDAKFRAMQQVLEQRKATIASASSTPVTRSKSSLSNPEKFRKNSTQLLNTKKESPKPSTVRKSWSSTPSPRATNRVSPAKTPSGNLSAGTTPTRRKAQPGPMGPQPSPKAERALQRPKPKPVQAATQVDSRKRTKGGVEKQLSPTTKNTKITKIKSQTVSEKENLSKDVAKPSFYSKVTKKSSVVPLESKPFLRKGSRAKAISPPTENAKNPENTINIEENKVVTDNFGSANQEIVDEKIELVDTIVDLQAEERLNTHELNDDIANCEQEIIDSDDILRRISHSELKTEVEEDLTISPTAWVEKEDDDDLFIPPCDNKCDISNIVNARPASPRIRHSLSQMLLQETELDIAEWGSAEIVPSIVYQKDAPKGFKKLLNFARKSKGDQNSTGWSTPSAFSEGEDDNEEFKGLNKKNADISLRKAALHASNHEHQKTLLDEGHVMDFAGPQRLSAHLKLNNFSTSSSNRLLDHNSSAITTNKGAKSFFSLSAFRGNKPNETKLR